MQEVIEKQIVGCQREITGAEAMIEFYKWENKTADKKTKGENTLKIQQLEKIMETNMVMLKKLKAFNETL